MKPVCITCKNEVWSRCTKHGHRLVAPTFDSCEDWRPVDGPQETYREAARILSQMREMYRADQSEHAALSTALLLLVKEVK